MNSELLPKIILLVLIVISYLTPLTSAGYELVDWFTTDDAFYYFEIASNIAGGNGSTFDGVNKTNGYHPLWMMILIPVQFLSQGSLLLSLRLIVIVQLLFAMATGVLFYQFLRSSASVSTSLFMSCCWTLYQPIHSVVNNGTEAVINAFFLTLLLVAYQKYFKSEGRSFSSTRLLLLGLAAVGVLSSRLDNIFLVFSFGVLLSLASLKKKGVRRLPSSILEAGKEGLLFSLPSGIFLAGFLIWNQVFFGTWMPLSGQIKRFWGSLSETVYGAPITGIGEFVGEFLAPQRTLGPWHILTNPLLDFVDSFQANYYYGTLQVSAGFFVVIGIAVMVGYLLREQREYVFQAIEEWAFIPLFAGAFFQILYYKLFGYLAPRSWYWIVEMLIIVVAFSIILEAGVRTLGELLPGVSRLMIPVLTVSAVMLVSSPYFRSLTQLGQDAQAADHYYLHKTVWLEQRTTPGSIIGMTGAGTTAYFIEDRSIMNLDGLVNSADYFHSLKRGQAAEFVIQSGVNYIFGNQRILMETDPYRENYQEILQESDMEGIFRDRLVLWGLDN